MSDYSEMRRLERKRKMARQEISNYEDQLSTFELILARLDALPDELQEANHENLRDETEANIERTKRMIEVMRSEAGPEERDSRQVRRARAREEAKASTAG